MSPRRGFFIACSCSRSFAPFDRMRFAARFDPLKIFVSFLRIAGFCGLMLVTVNAVAQLQRVPNTTLTNLPPQPPQFGYVVNDTFPE